MQVKLLVFTFYMNGGLHAVYIRKPYERMSNFWTVHFLKTNPNQILFFRTSLILCSSNYSNGSSSACCWS